MALGVELEAGKGIDLRSRRLLDVVERVVAAAAVPAVTVAVVVEVAAAEVVALEKENFSERPFVSEPSEFDACQPNPINQPSAPSRHTEDKPEKQENNSRVRKFMQSRRLSLGLRRRHLPGLQLGFDRRQVILDLLANIGGKRRQRVDLSLG